MARGLQPLLLLLEWCRKGGASSGWFGRIMYTYGVPTPRRADSWASRMIPLAGLMGCAGSRVIPLAGLMGCAGSRVIPLAGLMGCAGSGMHQGEHCQRMHCCQVMHCCRVMHCWGIHRRAIRRKGGSSMHAGGGCQSGGEGAATCTGWRPRDMWHSLQHPALREQPGRNWVGNIPSRQQRDAQSRAA